MESGVEILLRLQSVLGLLAFAGIAWAISENRSQVGWRLPAVGILLQLAVAGIVLHLPFVRFAFSAVNDAVVGLQAASEAGTSLVFGYLGGGPLPFEEASPGASFILAFRALPLIILMSALSALLLHWRVLPLIVRGFAFVLERSLKVGGAVSFATAANIFVGMVEAPLAVRPYLARLTRSEMFVMMTAGMATIAGTVFALYAFLLQGVIPDAAGHLLTASIISAPAAVVIARLMIPETEVPTDAESYDDSEAQGSMDAIVRGTGSGLHLFLNVLALLLVMVALVFIVNAFLGLLPDIGGAPLTLERCLGWLMAPLAWLAGVPWREAATAGSLMGVKTFLTEFVAFLQLSGLPEDALSDRSRLIMAYSLCGFANFASLGIMVGGLAAAVPERRVEIAGLGLKSIVSGTLATLSTGAAVGLVG